MSTPKLFTGGLDSGEEARKVPDITGEGAAEGVKARFVGDDSNRYEDRILSVPNSESSLGKIDLSLGADGFDDSPETSVEGDRDGNKIEIKKGRYGPYITNQKINAPFPKNKEIESMDLSTAQEIIAAKKAKGPTKFKRKKGK